MTVEKYEKTKFVEEEKRGLWSNESGDVECNECEEGAGERSKWWCCCCRGS
jgi:hypothetical protein